MGNIQSGKNGKLRIIIKYNHSVQIMLVGCFGKRKCKENHLCRPNLQINLCSIVIWYAQLLNEFFIFYSPNFNYQKKFKNEQPTATNPPIEFFRKKNLSLQAFPTHSNLSHQQPHSAAGRCPPPTTGDSLSLSFSIHLRQKASSLVVRFQPNSLNNRSHPLSISPNFITSNPTQ